MRHQARQERVNPGDRRSLVWLGLAALLLVAASLFIAHQEVKTRPLHVSPDLVDSGL